MKASWLFSKHPIIVDTDLATAVGLNEAIVLQQLNYWLHSKSAKRIDGKLWIYNTYDNWHDQNFPFWGIATIRRVFTKLEKKGLVVTGNFNKAGFDKTKWYSINEDKLNELMSRRCDQIDQTMRSKRSDGSGQNDQTDTRDYTETTTDIDDDDRPTSKKEESLIKGYEVFNHDLTKLERSTLISLIRKLPIETAEEVFDECSLRDSDDSLAYLIKSLQNAIKANGGGTSD